MQPYHTAMRPLLLLFGCLSLVSCATLSTGRDEQIRVGTSPSQANATLVCDGKPSGEGLTPIEFKIRRNAGDCNLTLRKEGFEEQTVAIEQGVNPAYWTNMLFSPLVPAGGLLVLGDSGEKVLGAAFLGLGYAIFSTDFRTGAVHAHKPATVDVVLRPVSH